MIPATHPTFTNPFNGFGDCKISYLSSVSGLVAWTDYIPVQTVTASSSIEGRTEATGYQNIHPVDATTNVAWTDYIPVYEDATKTVPWSTDANGYIPVGMSVDGAQAYLDTLTSAAAFDAALGVTSAGGFASAWADQSGNGRNLLQATGANQPIHLPFAGTKYGWLPGVAGNYFSTPDSVANSITGDIDIRVKVQKRDWTPAAADCYASKWNTSLAWLFRGQTTGELIYNWSADGASSVATVLSTAATGFTDNTEHWVRVTHDVDNGAGGNTVTFYTSDDGSTWTPLGTPVVNAGTTSIFNSTAIVELGTASGGTVNPLNGQISRAQIYNGIDGTLAVDFDPSRWSSGSTFTASTGETWTINSTGSKPAQIVDRPSLLFDGAAHYMKTAPFTLNQPETVYLVGTQVTWNSGDYLFDGNALNGGGLIEATGTPQVNLNAGSSVAGNTELTLGTRKVLCAVFNGASSSLQVTTGTATTGNAGAGNMSGFTLGAAGSNLLFGNIQAYEALIYNVAHDAATRSNIIRALMSKHGIT